MEKIEFEGWANCIRLSNREIELIVTTDVGPRILRFGFINQKNLLYVSKEDKGKTGGSQWRIYGGHRLWHAPEAMPRTYWPDNNPVVYTWNGKTLKLSQDIENTTGIVKEMEITLEPDSNQVSILHRLINKNLWTIKTCPWAITAQAAGGRAILPQEPFIEPAACLLPSRPLVLWHYTDMNDPRFKWGSRYIQVKQDSSLKTEQKIGILNKQGWIAYSIKNYLMVKRFKFDSRARYADYGCNNEVYVNENFLETETLGPMQKIKPENAAEHMEQWMILKTEEIPDTDSEARIDQLLLPFTLT